MLHGSLAHKPEAYWPQLASVSLLVTAALQTGREMKLELWGSIPATPLSYQRPSQALFCSHDAPELW